MPSGAGAIKAGDAYVALGIKENVRKQLDATAKQFEAFGKNLTNVGKKMAGVGVAIVAPLALAAKSFTDAGAHLDDVSQRTGVAVGELQALKYAADLSAVSFEDLEKGLQKMKRTIFEAATGSAAAGKSLASIGLSARELQGLAPEQQFAVIADHLGQVADVGARAALAMEIFGKGGAVLLPLIQQASGGLTTLAQRIQQSGQSFTSVSDALAKMRVAILSAGSGAEASRRALAGLGLSAKDLAGLSVDEQFGRIASKLGDVSDAGAKASIAVRLFGSEGAALLPTIGGSADAIASLARTAGEMGDAFGAAGAQARTTGRSIDTLAGGAKEAGAALDAIGLSLKALQGLSPAGQLKLIADHLGRIDDDGKRAAAAMALFGRQGAALGPSLAGHAGAIAGIIRSIADPHAGAGIKGIDDAIARLGQSVGEAAAGSDKASAALAQIGLTAKELQSLSPADQFRAVADALAKVTDAGKRGSVTLALFRAGMAGMAPALATDANALSSLANTAGESDVAFKLLGDSTATVAGGGRAAAKALDDLGLSVGQIRGLSPENQFGLIAARLAKVSDEAKRAALGAALFGQQAGSAAGLGNLAGSADGAGASASTAGGAFADLSKAVVSAAAGGAVANKAFADLGISIGDLTRLSPAEQFAAVASKLAGVTDQAKRAAVSTTLFGESAAKIGPLVQAGIVAAGKLGGAVGETGDVFKTLDAGIQRLNQSVIVAAGGGKQAADALNEIGLSAKQIQSLSPADQFKAVADALEAIGDEGKRTAAAMALFGKKGAELLPILKESASPAAELKRRFSELGIVISNEDIKAAAAFDDTLDELRKQVQAVTNAVGAAIVNGLSPFAKQAQGILKDIIGWTNAHRGLVQTALAVGAGFVAAGSAVIGLGLAFRAVGKAIDVTVGKLSPFKAILKTAFAAIAPAVRLALTVFTTSFGLIARVVLGAVGLIGPALGLLLTPIGLIGAAILAAGAAFLYFSGAGGKTAQEIGGHFGKVRSYVGGALEYVQAAGREAIEYLKNKFVELKEIAVTAFGGIADALAAGDLVLAGQFLWTSLQLLWVQGTQQLMGLWLKFKSGFVQVAAAAFYGALEIWAGVQAGLETAWTESVAFFKTIWQDAVAFFGNLWDGFVGTFSDKWNGVVDLVAEGLLRIQGQWDKSFNADAAVKGLHDTADAAKVARQQLELNNARNREDERKKNVGTIATDRKSAIDRINREQDDAVTNLNRREQGTAVVADKQAQDGIAEIEKKRAALEKQFREQRVEAAVQRLRAQNEKEAEEKGPHKKTLKELFEEFFGKIGAPQIKAAGTFNAAAVPYLGGGPVQVQDRIAKAVEDTAKNTKTLVGQRAKFR